MKELERLRKELKGQLEELEYWEYRLSASRFNNASPTSIAILKGRRNGQFRIIKLIREKIRDLYG